MSHKMHKGERRALILRLHRGVLEDFLALGRKMGGGLRQWNDPRGDAIQALRDAEEMMRVLLSDTQYPPNIIMMGGAALLLYRPDLKGAVREDRCYRIAAGEITEVVE